MIFLSTESGNKETEMRLVKGKRKSPSKILKIAREDIKLVKKYQFYHLNAAFAFRTKSSEVLNDCVNKAERLEAIRRVKSYSLLYNVAKERCERVDGEVFSSLCKAVKTKGREIKNSCIKNLYSGLRNSNFKQILKAGQMSYWLSHEEHIDKNVAKEILLFYKYFRKYKIGDSRGLAQRKKYFSKHLPKNYSLYLIDLAVIEILFSSQFTYSDFVNLYNRVFQQYKEFDLNGSK